MHRIHKKNRNYSDQSKASPAESQRRREIIKQETVGLLSVVLKRAISAVALSASPRENAVDFDSLKLKKQQNSYKKSSTRALKCLTDLVIVLVVSTSCFIYVTYVLYVANCSLREKTIR
jgi:hypothetical protein